MYFFAVFLLLSLGVMALAMLGERGYRQLREARSFVAVAWGVGLAWLADFNMWAGWQVPVRYEWVGVTLTGLALGGAALLSYAAFSFLMGLHRKFDDQAEEIEKSHLRKVA